MKKSISFLLGLWAALSLAGCSTNNKAAQEEVNVIVAADLHFDLISISCPRPINIFMS